ncbi:hypothetical protein [Priestia endophytica]|uniref:hypothetical protein n=1 Tax=Priestia endophytica TaxID=135735 RepID=UPI0022805D96|nr:hypothetical protein [Priestia endophytica]MCY8233696.1 hypothetical protein [Priestia endophytica]
MENYETELKEILASVNETSALMEENNVKLDNIDELVESNAKKAENILAILEETSKDLARLEATVDSLDKDTLKKFKQKEEIIEVLNRIDDTLESRLKSK